MTMSQYAPLIVPPPATLITSSAVTGGAHAVSYATSTDKPIGTVGNTIVSSHTLSDDIAAILTNIEHINNTAHVVRCTPITAFNMEEFTLPTTLNTHNAQSGQHVLPSASTAHAPPSHTLQMATVTPSAVPVTLGSKPTALASHISATARAYQPTNVSTAHRPFTSDVAATLSNLHLPPLSTAMETVNEQRETNAESDKTQASPIVQQLDLAAIQHTDGTVASSTDVTPLAVVHGSGVVETQSHLCLSQLAEQSSCADDTDDCHTLPGSVALLTLRDNHVMEQAPYTFTSQFIPVDHTDAVSTGYSTALSSAAHSRPIAASVPQVLANTSVMTGRQQVASAAHHHQLEQQRSDMLKSIQQQQQWIQNKLNAPVLLHEDAQNTFASPRVDVVQDIVQRHQSQMWTQSSSTPSLPALSSPAYSHLPAPVVAATDQHTQALLMSQQMMMQQQAASQAHNQQILTTLLSLLQDKQRSEQMMTAPPATALYHNLQPQLPALPPNTLISASYTPPVLGSPTSYNQAHTFSAATPSSVSAAPAAVAQQPYVSDAQRADLFAKCRNNRHTLVEELFAAGVPVDCSDAYGIQCLHIAAQNNSKRMVKACLRWGADINACNIQGNTALHYCMAYHYDVLSNYLLSKGASDQAVNFFGYTPQDGVLIPASREEAVARLKENVPTVAFTEEQLELILNHSATVQT